jgi:hypothetical protein
MVRLAGIREEEHLLAPPLSRTVELEALMPVDALSAVPWRIKNGVLMLRTLVHGWTAARRARGCPTGFVPMRTCPTSTMPCCSVPVPGYGLSRRSSRGSVGGAPSRPPRTCRSA